MYSKHTFASNIHKSVLTDMDNAIYEHDQKLSALNGRKITFIGDSMTQGTGASHPYPWYMNQYFGCISTNKGIAGSCVSTRDGQQYQPMITTVTSIASDVEIIVIVGGTNDYGLGVSLGTSADTEDGTFYGAYYSMLKYLKENYPDAYILCCTPFHRGVETTSGRVLSDYVDAVKTVCRTFAVPVLDLYAESGIDYKTGQARYFSDSVHFNDAGYKREACIVGKWLENHYFKVE